MRLGAMPHSLHVIIRAGRRAEGVRLRLRRKHHPWAVAWHGRRQSPCCISAFTRPVSWLGPAVLGAHPRTKGARWFTGGHRCRIPSIPKGLLAAPSKKLRGDPSEWTEESPIRESLRTRLGRPSPSRPVTDDSRPGRARGRRRRSVLGGAPCRRSGASPSDGGGRGRLSRRARASWMPMRPLKV